MPELDDDRLFAGGGAAAVDDDDELFPDGVPASDGAEDDEAEDEGKLDLEGQFDEEDEPKKPAAKAGEKGGDQSKRGGEKTIVLSRKDYEALQARAREKEVEEAYWRGKAEAGSKGKRESDEDEEDAAPPVRKAKPATEDEDAEAFLADVNKRGMKAIRERGMMSRDEVEALIEERAAKIARGEVGKATEALHSDAQLIRQYPDLNDPESEFSKRVAKEVRGLVAADKNLARSNATILAASRIVAAQMRSEKSDTTNRDRERRIAKQAPVSRRGEDDSITVPPLQRQMLSGMMRGLGLKESVDEVYGGKRRAR